MSYMDHFNAAQVKDALVQWIRYIFEANGKGCNAVIGISGGKDSTVAAALCAEALGPDHVIGVMMPDGWQKDSDDAREVIELTKICWTYVNIEKATSGILDRLDTLHTNVDSDLHDMKILPSEQTKRNLPPRIRMATLYAVAQSFHGRVINTSNLSEAWVGWSTRWGDSVGDFAPLANLTTDEIVAIGRELGLPAHLIEKAPSDGLCGKTDEDALGFSYSTLNEYIRTGVCDNADVKAKIDALHDKNYFKLCPMPEFPDYIME